MLTYCRDAIAAPLREMIKVIQALQHKQFFPDTTRSGYFGHGQPSDETDADSSSSSSSAGSTDEEEPGHSDEENAVQLDERCPSCTP